MTILFVHGVDAIGGAERELLVILERLSGLGFHVIVVCPESGALVQEVRRRGIPTRSVPFAHWRKWLSFFHRFRAVRRLRDAIRSEVPSLIHVNDMWWVPQTLRAAEGMGIPIVGHVRQEIEPSKVARYGLQRLDLALAVSNQIRRSLCDGGVASDRVRTLYSGLDLTGIPDQESGVDVRRRLGIPSHSVLLGTVANLFPRKGYEIMLQALPAILAVVPDVYYVIVGSGESEYEQSLRECAINLGIADRVCFAGFQSSIYPYLKAIDLYVHPSLMEGFGIAVIEAMAMGKAVVATSVGGLPEVVLDGETGLIVPPADSLTLARSVIHLIQNLNQREVFGKAGRRRVESLFTVDSMMAQLISAYQAILDRQGVKSANGQRILP